MPTPSDWLSWEFWAKNSEGLYHLSLIVGGAIGILLLAWRTISANRSAWAAQKQAKTAADQAKTAAERHEEQTKADRERRITESFAKAIEQLGSDKLETRLGGIYTLERVSHESEREYWPIMETLTAFVRERAPWPPPSDRPQAVVRPATDIQAILTILGRRNEQVRNRDEVAKRRLDLAATDLRGASLQEARLERADLAGAHLEGANIWRVHLEGADLRGAHLENAYIGESTRSPNSIAGGHFEGANLLRAHLEGADLGRAHFNDARLSEAHLEETCLWEAHFEGADLRLAHLDGADLTGAIGVTQEQLNLVFGDDRTALPPSLARPEDWSPDESDG